MNQLILTPTTKNSIPKTPKLELRDYQKQVIREIYKHYENGVKSVMLVSGTLARI